MRTSITRHTTPKAFRLLFISTAAALILCCAGHDSNRIDSLVPLAPFIQLANQGLCHDLRNRLFLIDRHLVFWDRAGNCSDNAYSQILYADSPDTVLCVRHDSVGGEVKTYPDPQYKALFDTAIANIDHPDLGLSRTHTIQIIHF